MNRADFLAERRTGIGSSDAASLMNVGWGCERRLFYDKLGVPADYPFEGNNLTRLGQALEPLFRNLYEEKSGRIVLHDETAKRHPDHPFMLTHLDGVAIKDGSPDMILEIKALGRAMFYKAKREGISEDYILQVQWSLMVTQWHLGVFAIGNRDSGDMLDFEFGANQQIGEMLRRKGIEFWQRVQESKLLIDAAAGEYPTPYAPDRLSPDDARCHRCEWRDTCQGNALMEIAKKDDGSIPEANDLFPLYQEYKERASLVQQAEDLLDETKEELKTRLGDRAAVSVNGRKIYYRPQTMMRWDGAELAEYSETLRAKLRSAMQIGDAEFDRMFPEMKKKPSVSRPLRLF